MELELIRTYYPAATNGKIFYQDRLMMYSIELRWKDNHNGYRVFLREHID